MSFKTHSSIIVDIPNLRGGEGAVIDANVVDVADNTYCIRSNILFK